MRCNVNTGINKSVGRTYTLLPRLLTVVLPSLSFNYAAVRLVKFDGLTVPVELTTRYTTADSTVNET